MVKEDFVTLFSFGYGGWGTSTAQLVQSLDALERSRGFNPPVLVDIRICRSVRAPGFNGRALERLVGADRYVHIPQLGNRAVMEDTGEAITIADPDAADSLFNLAINERQRTRRIVFFCACLYQLQGGKPTCHRYEVGSLLLAQSRERYRPIVAEWPGTEPQVLNLALPSEALKKLRRGVKSVPLPGDIALDHVASIAWGSVVHCHGEGESFHARVDRAKWSTNGWYLPVLGIITGNGAVASSRERRSWGFFERRGEA
jgi:hypothetical protein